MECFDIHSYSYRSIDKKLRLTAYSQLPTNFNPRTSNFSKLNTHTSILTLNHQPSTINPKKSIFRIPYRKFSMPCQQRE